MDELISRNAALALVVKAIHGTDSKEIQDYLFGGLRKELWALPSEQLRPKGKWEEKEVFDGDRTIEQYQSARCSVCGKYHTTPYMYYFNNFNYCPECGAEMSGEKDD